MIRIFKDGYEIDVVKETLTITRDNKFLDNDFKIQANSFPFMIIENESTRKALGSNIISSANRNIYYQVVVITPEGTFEGELQILSYLKNYRKCNLRFYSPIYNLRDKNISEFLPERISTVSGPIQPLYNYEEKRSTLIEEDFQFSWMQYGANVLTMGFPNTLFNLPLIQYPDQFGTDLAEDDVWIQYSGNINDVVYDEGVRYMQLNQAVFSGGLKFIQPTVNAPKVYLLTPLKLALESIGYQMDGSFINNSFVRRLLFDSENNNLTEIKLEEYVTDIDYYSQPYQPALSAQIKTIPVTLTTNRTYRMEIVAKKVRNVTVTALVEGYHDSEIILGKSVTDNFIYDEVQTYTVEFVIPPVGVNTIDVNLLFFDMSLGSADALDVSSIKVYEVSQQSGFVSHPIINLQRFVPDWSFIDYINELKKLFNLKITPNEYEKKLYIDFFNTKFEEKGGVLIDSLFIEEPEALEFDSVLLSYDNDEDKNMYVSKNQTLFGTNKPTLHTKEIQTKFKYLPTTNLGLTLTKEIEDKGGVGLLLYDHTDIFSSRPLASYNNRSLSLDNIFQTDYRLSFSNYLQTGIFTAKGYLSNKQIKDIAAEDFVIIDNKRYYVNTMSYKETPNGLYETKLELLLMIY